MKIKNIFNMLRKIFHIIPYQFPLITIILIGIVTFCYFFWTSANGLFINLISGLICVLITPYLVTYLLFVGKEKEWKAIESILYSRVETFIIWIIRNIAESLKINLIKHLGPINYLTMNLNIEEVKELIDVNLVSEINNFKPVDLEIFNNALLKEKQDVADITLYMEKLPYFLHIIELHEIEWILEDITSKYLVYKITGHFNHSETIVKGNPDYARSLIDNINRIIEIVIGTYKNKVLSKRTF